jgi:hypothetical protein
MLRAIEGEVVKSRFVHLSKLVIKNSFRVQNSERVEERVEL